MLISHSVMSSFLRPHGLQHTRVPCPSTSPRACSNSCPLCWWCYITISLSVAPFLIFPSIRVSSNDSVLHIKRPKYWSFNFRISPSNDYSGLISFRIDWFDLLAVHGTLSRVFSSTTIWKCRFFTTQPSLGSNLHICTWLLGKPQFWLYRPLQAKWYLCFSMYCLSLLSFQGANIF